MKLKLLFPGVAEDLSDAFNSAISQGLMQRDNQRDRKTFFASFELVASDVDGDEIVQADWFLNEFTNEYTRILRKEGSE